MAIDIRIRRYHIPVRGKKYQQMNTPVPYRVQTHGLGNAQTPPLTVADFTLFLEQIYRTRINQMRRPNETVVHPAQDAEIVPDIGAVPPWPQPVVNQPAMNLNVPVLEETATVAAPWNFNTNTTTATQRRAARRVQRRLEIHPLMRDLTPTPTKPVMSEDAKAFWRGRHFNFDCQ
jgi:hypothetical protein